MRKIRTMVKFFFYLFSCLILSWVFHRNSVISSSEPTYGKGINQCAHFPWGKLRHREVNLPRAQLVSGS